MSDELEPRPELPTKDEIELRLKDARAKIAAEMLDDAPVVEIPEVRVDPFDDAEFRSRYEEISNRAKVIQEKRAAAVKTQAKKEKSDRESAKGLGVGLSIAYTILGMPVAGYLIGWAIDGNSVVQTGRNFGTLIGAFIGVAAAVMMMNRTNTR
jgi:F0F1-type ATP synthase assembly protein I